VAAAEVLARHATIETGERVLICPSGSGALGVWAARRTSPAAVVQRDTHWGHMQRAVETWQLAGLPTGADLAVGLPDSPPAPVDVVLMPLPKGRDLARLLLLAAFRALRPGGRLYLAGANNEGIKSVVGDAAALFGEATVLGYKGGHRVALATRPEAEPAPLPEIYATPGIAAGTWHTFAVETGGESFQINSRPGVFSWQHLDPGSALLLDHLQVRITDRVLDVGCGYGILGMAAARAARRGSATLVDVDWLACESARANLAANGIANAEVVLGSGVAAAGDRAFSLIISNPPFHAGHQVSLAVTATLVQEAYAALEPGGRLLLVANRFLAYDHTMAEVFGNVETVAQDAGYHLLLAEKTRARQPRRRETRRRPRTGDYEETIYQIPD
jgi:16S rRNA (guanine1207-N2)-methyltransferase